MKNVKTIIIGDSVFSDLSEHNSVNNCIFEINLLFGVITVIVVVIIIIITWLLRCASGLYVQLQLKADYYFFMCITDIQNMRNATKFKDKHR